MPYSLLVASRIERYGRWHADTAQCAREHGRGLHREV